MLALLRGTSERADLPQSRADTDCFPDEIERARQLEDDAVRATIDWQPNVPPSWVKPYRRAMSRHVAFLSPIRRHAAQLYRAADDHPRGHRA